MWWLLLCIPAALLLVCLARTVFMRPTAGNAAFDRAPDERARVYAETLGALIRCETVSALDQPDKSVFFGFHRLLESRFPCVHQQMEKQVLHGSLLFCLHGTNGGQVPPVLLMSHHDVVEAQGAWTHPAFSGETDGERIWGRGTLDTKGSLFCILQAAEELLKDGWQPPYDFYIASACTEETNGAGARETVEWLRKRGVHLGLLLDEGGMVCDTPLPGVNGMYALVGVLEKGYGDLKFTASGNGGHSSAPAPGSPIARLAAFVRDIERHDPFKPQMNATVREMLRRMAPNATFGLRFLLANLWLFASPLGHLLPAVSPLAGAMVKTTAAFTTMRGSDGLNVMPAEAYVTANLRFIPHQGADESIELMKKRAEKYGLHTEVLQKEYPCRVVPYDSAEFRFVEKAAETVFPGVCVTPYAMTGGTDAKYYNDICDACLRFAPLYADAQQIATIHGRDENLFYSALPKGVDFYKAVLRNWPDVR